MYSDVIFCIHNGGFVYSWCCVEGLFFALFPAFGDGDIPASAFHGVAVEADVFTEVVFYFSSVEAYHPYGVCC